MFFISIRLQLISLLLIGAGASAIAQLQQLNRFEIPIDLSSAPYEVESAEEKGLYLCRHLAGAGVEIIRVDTALAVLWSGTLPLEKTMVLARTQVFKNDLYLLTRNTVRPDFQFIRVTQEGNFTVYPIQNYLMFLPTEFEVTDQGCLIGGYFNRVPLTLFYSLKTEKPKVLPGLFNEAGELTQLKRNDDQTFDLLIRAKNLDGQQTLWVKSYTEEGDLLKNIALIPEPKKSLLFGRSIKISNDLQLIAGVYGNKNTEYSRGIFVATLNQYGDQQLRYYSFGELENFFKYMKVKRELRVKQRIERRKVKGKKIKFNYRFLINELFETNNQFVLMGEAFYPKYKQQTSGFAGSNTLWSSTNSYQVFDGYRYTHAVVLGIDKSGKLQWDNSFEINDIKTFDLEPFVRTGSKRDTLSLYYAYGTQIRSKLIYKNQVVEGKTVSPIATQSTFTRIVEGTSATAKLDNWYADVLIAYGTHRIETILPGGGTIAREVFYINKLRSD